MSKAKTKGNTVAGILRRAMARIEAGWARGAKFKFRNGVSASEEPAKATNFCAVGAVSIENFLAAGMNKTDVALQRLDEATRLVTRFGDSWCFDVMEYNDEPGRKKAQILAIYRKAIELQTHRPA